MGKRCAGDESRESRAGGEAQMATWTRPRKQREGQEVGGPQSTLSWDESPASKVCGPEGPAPGASGLALAFLLRSVISRGSQGSVAAV